MGVAKVTVASGDLRRPFPNEGFLDGGGRSCIRPAGAARAGHRLAQILFTAQANCCVAASSGRGGLCASWLRGHSS